MPEGREYRRVMLGPKSAFAADARANNWIGAGYIFGIDLTGRFHEEWREFNREMIPVFLEQNPEKTKVAAGLACGMLWTICKGTKNGDIVLCPDGNGNYYVGEVTGDYVYAPDSPLPHHRPVHWFDRIIARHEMSDALRNSTGSIGSVSTITKYAEEIERLIGNLAVPMLVARDENVEDASVFALEKHLEDFLVANWESTLLGKKYDIYTDDGERVGQQFPSDTGPIDILAISKDKKELVVIELKKGRASDVVVGQIQRYMGYVLDELAEEDQTVRGIIIAREDDLKLRRSLRVTSNIEFFRYQVSFQLLPSNNGSK